ncbi:MAG: hypothetical protein DRH03_10695, partial [Deltaproteobacteria bacterium]
MISQLRFRWVNRLIVVVMITVSMFLSCEFISAAPMPPTFAPLVSKLTPAVVNINTEKHMRSRNSRGFDAPGRRGGHDPFEDFFGRFFDRNQSRSRQRPVKSLGS